MTAVVAIVGRPNVGKSTLFNRLIGSRKAIVDDLPGVTRDRNYGDVEWDGHEFTLIDTGGFDPTPDDPMLTLMRQQAQLAIEEADIILFVVDARSGVTSADREIADMLRKTHKPVFTLANKVEGRKVEQEAVEVYELGTDRTYMTSGEHGLGIDEVMEDVVPLLPAAAPELDVDESCTRVAIIGRPNVGKSSIINKLLGEERLLASDVPGTTRDSIDSRLDLPDGRQYLLVDTAGMRRKRSISMRIERYSVVQAMRSIDRAHVAILAIDASQELADQDARLAGVLELRGCPGVVAVNKWDKVEKDSGTAGNYVRHFRERIPSCAHMPVVFTSALTGQRVNKLLEAVDGVRERNQKRIPTGELNRLIASFVRRQRPPNFRGRFVKFYYATQVAIEPPTFILRCNYPKAIPESYRRFLIGQLRQAHDFSGIPIRVFFRPRSEAKEGGKDAPTLGGPMLPVLEEELDVSPEQPEVAVYDVGASDESS